MPQTNAERQAAWRRRRGECLTALRAEVATAAGTIGKLEHERDQLYKMLETVNETPVSASTGPAANCPHPAHLVDGLRCGGCGQSVDSW